jgi:carotenoid cleavage dioxygenase-like enzyme
VKKMVFGIFLLNGPTCTATLWRWVVDVDAGELVSSTRMCAEPSDFPCINPDFVGLPHRYAYTTGYQPGTEPVNRMDIPSFDRVLKHDLRTVGRSKLNSVDTHSLKATDFKPLYP